MEGSMKDESYKGSSVWTVRGFRNSFDDFWIKNLELKYGNEEPYYSIAKMAFEAGFDALFERQRALERDNEVLLRQLKEYANREN